MSKTSRIFVGALSLCLFSANVSAKYCVKLPSCEELGYIFPYKEGRRSIRCPFDTSKVLYLDYCQAYGLTSRPSGEAGVYQECTEEKADGTKINTGYYRYIRCNSGYVYESGNCVRKRYKIGEVYYYNNTAIGVVYYDNDETTKIVALTDINTEGEPTSGTEMHWSTNSSGTYDYDVDGLTNNITSSDKAIQDMNGKSNTQKILAYIQSQSHEATAATATNKYAPSTCTNDSICGAGAWYLPAAGELVTLYNNMSTINSNLSSAGGSAISTSNYWSSNEFNRYYAWSVDFNSGTCSYDYKYNSHYVRPVLEISHP